MLNRVSNLPRLLIAALAALVPCLVSCADEPPRCDRPAMGETMLEEEFVLIEPGEFMMGSTNPQGWAYPQMHVRLSRPIWMQTTEVTDDEWWRVSDAWLAMLEQQGTESDLPPGAWGTTVEDLVRQKDAVPGELYPFYNVYAFPIAYANIRSALEGYTMCYDLSECRLWETLEDDGKDSYRTLGCAQVAASNIDPDCDGYRLPTEAEWEYAARAGTTTEYLTGETDEGMERYAIIQQARAFDWDIVAPWSGAQPIARACPNAWGLYDMQGGVREWTGDFRGRYAPGDEIVWHYAESLVDPQEFGPDIFYNPEDTLWFVDPVDPIFEGLSVPNIIVRGADPGSDWTWTRSSAVGLIARNELAGFRVVRTAFEVMEERAAQ